MLYGVQQTVTYIAWDTSANAGKTGDSANHTLRWVKNGTSAAPTNTPSEVDATNAPGLYKITLTATEWETLQGTLAGKSSTANVSVIPQQFTTMRGPNAAPGTSGGLPTVDASNKVNAKLDWATDVSSKPTIGTSTLTAQQVWEYATRTLSAFGFAVTLSSDAQAAIVAAIELELTNDATGQAFMQAIADKLANDFNLDDLQVAAIATACRDAVLNRLLAGNHDTTGTLGKLAQNLDATITSRLASSSYTAPLDATATKAAARAAIDDYDPPTNAEMTARTLTAADYFVTGDYTAPDNAGIAAIKSKTDNLPVQPASQGSVDAIATILAGITSLAKWLRAFVRKDTPDSTALSEINSGGGAYSAATDSQEAIRDRGDAAWITGAGGSAGAVYVLPLQSTPSNSGRLPETYLTAYQGCKFQATFAVTDRGNTPVDLTGYDLDFVTWLKATPGTPVLTLSSTGATPALTISGEGNNQVTIDAAATSTPTAGQYEWRLYGDGEIALATGTLKIEAGAMPPTGG
jgi:hypothetical protein